MPSDGDDMGGAVAGPSGPETGVRVIAETTEPGNRFFWRRPDPLAR